MSGLLAYEALGDLGTDDVVVDTPVADAVPVRRVNEAVLLVPILRAGLGMVPAIQEIVPTDRGGARGPAPRRGDLAVGGLSEPIAPRPHRSAGHRV